MSAFDKLGTIFDRAVHHSVRDDELMRARQRAFISSHVLGSLLALAVLTVFFCALGFPNVFSIGIFAWFLTPLLIALYLSRTARLGTAHFLSATNLIGLVVLIAAMTGGVRSFAIVWMIAVPMEAALSGSRRIIMWSSLAALSALVGLYGLSASDMLPPPVDTSAGGAVLELFGHLAAVAYSGGLALNIEAIHRQASDAIKREHERFRLLADNATDLISRHGADGRVLFASPASLQLTGEPPEALRDAGMLDRVLVADRPAFLGALDDAARGAHSDAEFRLRRLLPDGAVSKFVWAEIRCRPADPPAESASATSAGRCEIVAVTRDISRRKQYESELLSARTTADTANRAKSLFLANMSHELRTPLNAIIGFSDILQTSLKKLPEGQRWSEHSSIIRDSGEQLLVMVNELLDISKIESGHFRLEPEPVDVGAMAAACRATLALQLDRKTLKLKIEMPDDLPDIEADARCIRQMLLNLIGNAIKFSREAGTIIVRARVEGDDMILEVVDTGIGIASADVAKLGQPFVQANSGYNRQHEGTGLGLSLVKGMARLHGGSIAIESEPDRGTTVRLTLPMMHARPAHSEPGDAAGRHHADRSSLQPVRSPVASSAAMASPDAPKPANCPSAAVIALHPRAAAR